jgi:hypothetical protein
MKSKEQTGAIPASMLGEREGTERIGPDHFEWLGEQDVELKDIVAESNKWLVADEPSTPPAPDADAIIRKHGYDPDTPLEYHLRALIRAHGATDDNDLRERTKQAFALITGKPRRGRPSIEDDSIALEVVHRLKANHFSEPRKMVPLKTVVGQVVRDYASDFRSPSDMKHVIQRVAKKIAEDKHILLAREGSDMAYNRMDALRSLDEAAKLLAAAGVKIDRAVFEPVRRRGLNL